MYTAICMNYKELSSIQSTQLQIFAQCLHVHKATSVQAKIEKDLFQFQHMKREFWIGRRIVEDSSVRKMSVLSATLISTNTG